MIIIPPPQRKRPSRAKVRTLTGMGPVPPPTPPPDAVTALTDASTYVIDPAVTVTLTIADVSPGPDPGAISYTVQISYDGGTTWNMVGDNQPQGDNLFNPAAQFPGVTPGAHCRFRATNNGTGNSGVSNEFALTAE